MLTDLEKQIIASLQEDMAITERPYLEISAKLGVSEETLLETLQSLCDRGIIRRFGATLRHQKTGFTANAMGAYVTDSSSYSRMRPPRTTQSLPVMSRPARPPTRVRVA